MKDGQSEAIVQSHTFTSTLSSDRLEVHSVATRRRQTTVIESFIFLKISMNFKIKKAKDKQIE